MASPLVKQHPTKTFTTTSTACIFRQTSNATHGCQQWWFGKCNILPAEILWLFGVPIFVYSASIAEKKKTCWQLYRTKTTSSIISRTWQTYLVIMQCIKNVHWNFVSVAFSRIFRTKDISWRNLSTVTYSSLRRVVSTQSCSTAYSSPAPLPQHITPWVGSKHV